MHAVLTVKLNEILAEANPSKFSDELGDFYTDPNIGGVGPKDLASAPPLIKGAIFVRAFDLDVFSGGIYGWLMDEYDDYPNLADFFDRIKATRAANYIRCTLKLFPKTSDLKDPDRRFEFCDQNEEKLNRLDRRFAGASEDAIKRLRKHLIAHRSEFERQVEEYWVLRKRHHRLFEKSLEKLREQELRRPKSRR